ncbi:MAG TPA: hypothetical protein VM012_11540 [Flavitalea sp.]|nr:hypothetical protein [Flavitalea sp.]
MVKTGSSILELFSMLAILLPVIPLLIIVFRKLYALPVIQLLTIACLLGFGEFLVRFINIDPAKENLVNALFRTTDCALLLLLFKVMSEKKLSEILNFTLICSTSVFIAIYFTTGIEKHHAVIRYVQGFLMIGSSILVLAQLVRLRESLLFELPVFWIASATFFYYCMSLIIERITVGQVATTNASTDKIILFHLIHFVRYLFYIITVIITHPRQETLEPDNDLL